MKEDFYDIKNIIAMRKIILILSILLVGSASMDAQVRSTFFCPDGCDLIFDSTKMAVCKNRRIQ